MTPAELAALEGLLSGVQRHTMVDVALSSMTVTGSEDFCRDYRALIVAAVNALPILVAEVQQTARLRSERDYYRELVPDNAKLRAALQEACDILALLKYGGPAADKMQAKVAELRALAGEA